MILGVDEVGRGAWAGPLVVGAVVLGDTPIDGLTDSKLLSKKRRDELYDEITAHAAGVGLGWVSAREIDEEGLSAALAEATRRAVRAVNCPFHEIIIDGTINFLAGTPLEHSVTTLKKADLLIGSVSAAAIVAKVARDRYMARLDDVYPHHRFSAHVGYGTPAHQAALKSYGVTPEHRRSFAPIAALTALSHAAPTQETAQTSKQIGDSGEAAAAKWLAEHGYSIISRNWKTRLCEIDIIAMRNDTVYFVEVKHRKTSSQGGGIAAITDDKRRRMTFAAELYAQRFTLRTDLRLAVMTTIGVPPVVEHMIELRE